MKALGLPHARVAGLARGRRSIATSLTIGVTVLVAAVLVGLLLGASVWLPLLVLLGVPLALGLVLLGLGTVPQQLLRGLLPLGALVVLATPAFQQVLHLPVGYVLELLIFSLLLGAIIQARLTMPNDLALRWVAMLFLIYLALGILSSVMGRSRPIAGLWQFQYNLKWIAMFLIGTLLVWDQRADRVLRWILLLVWLPLLTFVVLEWASPGLHRQLLGLPTDSTINPLLGGLRRFRGPLLHSGYLALLSAVFAWFCIVYALSLRQWRWALLALVYAGLLVASGQRQETAGFVLALMVLLGVKLRRQWPLLGFAALMLGGALVCLALLFDYVPMKSLFAQWGLGDPLDALSERAILTQKGIEVANGRFPLGAGLGTYGGAGAQKFDQSLFADLGFGRFWWFREGKFLVDVYWPSIAAESGWLAAGSLATCFAILIFSLVKRLLASGGQDPLLLFAVGALLILISNTPSSASITDPRGSIILWLVIGAAWRQSQAQRAPEQRRPAPAALPAWAAP